MLFSEKENVFMCLAATKFVLRKINFGVWFIQTFLQKMLYIPNFPYTSSTVNMRIMNQFHTHSQKKQNPAKKFIKSGQIEIAQRRRRWDRVVKARSSGGEIGGEIEWRDRRQDRAARLTSGEIDKLRDRRVARSTIGTVRSSDWSSVWVAGEVTSSSLSPIWALSLSLFPEMI